MSLNLTKLSLYHRLLSYFIATEFQVYTTFTTSLTYVFGSKDSQILLLYPLLPNMMKEFNTS